MKNNIPLLRYVLETRKFGHTYIHAEPRRAYPLGVETWLGDREIRITWSGWGRSLQTKRGHKYKAHANFVDTGKPVPSKLLAMA